MSTRLKPKRSNPDPASRRAAPRRRRYRQDPSRHAGRSSSPGYRRKPAASSCGDPGQPGRALLNHFKDQIPDFDAAFPEDSEKERGGALTPRSGTITELPPARLSEATD